MMCRPVGRPVVGAILLALSACVARQPVVEVPSGLTDVSLAEEVVKAQLGRYVEAQVALAADDFDSAKNALGGLLPLSDDTIRSLVRLAANADDIKTMRARFKPLSEHLAAQQLPLGYAKAYCPMYNGGSSWVQADGPVRNPYFGSVMLTCGVVDAAPGAHMDHSPQHGGVVFMAPDSFHHVEGAYPADQVFRLYATDNYREPVDVRDWSGRVILEEVYDSETDEFAEVGTFSLLPSPDGSFLEALTDPVGLPGEFIAKVEFGDSPEERFDFVFSAFSVVGFDAPDNVPLAERVRPRIPELSSEVVSELAKRNELVRSLIEEGRFSEIFIPALQAKELGLALLERRDGISLPEQNRVRIAVRHLVRAAYLLDWYGDLGNRQQVTGAYDIFAGATQSIIGVYENIRQRER